MKLVNDYGTGERNGEIKILECALSDKDKAIKYLTKIKNKYPLE